MNVFIKNVNSDGYLPSIMMIYDLFLLKMINMFRDRRDDKWWKKLRTICFKKITGIGYRLLINR